MKVATWNIHGAIGRDGRYAPGRIFDVLGEMSADVVALQEVASLEEHGEFLGDLRRATGYDVVVGPTMVSRKGGDFGNAILSRHPITRVERLDLCVDRCEPRGALDVEIDVGSRRLRVVGTHLGLRPSERREQVRRLLAALESEEPLSTVLMGDVNEWYLWGRPLRWLHAHFRSTPAPPTFPSLRPVFALDRIWVHPLECLQRVQPHLSSLARIASDHLPLTAELELGCA